MSNRRVLRIITRLNVGGPATHVVLADRGLAERGWETLLVHGRVEPDEAEIDTTRVTTPLLRIPRLARPIRPADDALVLARLVGLIRSYRPAIIHTHLSKAGMLGRLAGMAASPAPRVHTFHGTVFADYFGRRSSGAITRLERSLGHRTHAILALSERQRVELVEHRIAPSERIRIVPLGLDLERFGGIDRQAARRTLGLDAAAPLVVAVGRLVPIKRLDRLLRAFAGVEQAPGAQLALVGGGGERDALEALAGQLGIRERVRFVGWSSETPAWYAAADIVALTSDREGTPLALIEAAAAGRPAVATDVGGVSDIIEHGVTGFVVPREDEAALTARLDALLSDVALREQMGAVAPARAAHWSAGRLVRDLDTAYHELLEDRR